MQLLFVLIRLATGTAQICVTVAIAARSESFLSLPITPTGAKYMQRHCVLMALYLRSQLSWHGSKEGGREEGTRVRLDVQQACTRGRRFNTYFDLLSCLKAVCSAGERHADSKSLFRHPIPGTTLSLTVVQDVDAQPAVQVKMLFVHMSLRDDFTTVIWIAP